MSGNQKQAPSGAPQQQARYQQISYSGRATAPQRADAYHVSTPPSAYMQQQASTQPSGQGGSMRAGGGAAGAGGIPPAGPPNQSSTPPQTDLKLQPQAGQLQVAFISQQIRGGQPAGAYYPRTGPPQPGQASGGPRMPNHHRQSVAANAVAAAAAGSLPQLFQQMPIYNPQPAQPYPMQMSFNTAARPQIFYQQSPYPPPIITNAHIFNNSYTGQQPQPIYYQGGPMQLAGRPGPAAAGVASGSQTGASNAGAPAAMPPIQPPIQQLQKKRPRANAIPIIHPDTGKYVTCEEESQPPSGDSSARETPQPASAAAALTTNNMFMSADFAARVAIAASEGKEVPPPSAPPVVPDMVVEQTMGPYSQPPPGSAPGMPAAANHRNGDAHRLADAVVQNSKLQANIKEFVPEVRHGLIKESATPVVSANTDGVEVTLPSKQSRERDSPHKTRKHQHSQQQQHSHQHQHQHQHHQQQQQQQPPPPLHCQLPPQPPREMMPPKESSSELADVAAPPASHAPPLPLPVHEPSEPRTNKVVLSAPPPPAPSKAKLYSENKAISVTPPPADKPAADEPAAVAAPAPAPTPAPIPAPTPASVSTPTPTPTATLGKSRGGGQRNRESSAMAAANANAGKQQQPQPARQSVPVPSSQPPKPSSKANRARELNTKGASKEGTDMDAFDTSEPPSRADSNLASTNEHVPAPVPPPPSAPAPAPLPAAAPVVAPPTNATAASVQQQPAPPLQLQPQPPQPAAQEQQQRQQSPSPQPQEQPQQQQQPVPISAPSVPKIEHQPAVSAAPTPPTPPTLVPSQPQNLPEMKPQKPRMDVTSIVKEEPRPMRPLQPQPPSLDAQDETDRVASEKLVQAKNEANTIRTNADNNEPQIIDKTIRYKKDQWSPINKDGKKCYDRDFLICLRHNPKSKHKPDNLPDLDVVLKDNTSGMGGGRARMLDARSYGALSRPSESLMPIFHKSLSQRGPLPKRNSQQGKAGGGGGGGGKAGGNKPNPIHVTLSLREDVKLRETENAWRPARLNSSAAISEYEAKSQELYKKVRGVLNKLTPEKFDKLVNQVHALSIDNTDRLQGVIDLVFEKAVDEPNFSVAYALMCKELAMMQVPSGTKNKDDKEEFVNFRKLLINRCQGEFEKNTADETMRDAKQKEIDECTDPEKKKELQLLLEEDIRRARIKSVGNIRFIGELFKQQMLTTKIMMRCIKILLDNHDEDSLECLCKLLTTIGKDLEVEKKQDLKQFFINMEEIVEKRPIKISSRVRFMLQDVIDLRKSNWVPRRQDLNPKTMEQIQKEADTEQLNIQVMNTTVMSTPRKDERGGVGGSDRDRDRDRKRRNQTDDGWTTQSSRNRPLPYTFEVSKLLNVKPPAPEETMLGSKQMFGTWCRGSNIKPQQQQHHPVTNTANMYAALENMDADKARGASSGFELRLSKDPYVAKGHSMERGTYKHSYEDGRGSRSGSQQRQQQQQQRSLPPASAVLRQQPAQQMMPPQQPSAAAQPPPAPAPPTLTPEQIQMRMQETLDELLSDCCSMEDCEESIRSNVDASRLGEFLVSAFTSTLERSANIRHKVGKLATRLLNSGLLSVDVCCSVVADVLSQADDLLIDIPKIWEYLAELLVPLVAEKAVVPFRRLLDTCLSELKAQGHAHKLLAHLLKMMVAESGPGLVAERWRKSGASLAEFVPADKLDSYVEEHNLDFLMGGAGAPVAHLTSEQLHHKLLQFFKSNTQFDTITDWITANVGERVKEKEFVRTLVTAIVENAVVMSNKKLRTDVLKSHYGLLQRYVDTKEALELQTLLALQALVHKWEHPPGLLLAILERFWEDGILSTESFLTWEQYNDPAEQEGKGVALKSLQSLFTALKEADDESGSSMSEGA